MRAARICLFVSVAMVSAAAAQEKTITLPADHDYGKLKPATHSDLAETQCQFCHSTDYIVMQPRGDAKQWEGVVTKMIKVFGAPLSESDAKAITEYLTKNYGPLK
jgi:sulfite dehydrogenase (cytochrome) subunit B